MMTGVLKFSKVSGLLGIAISLLLLGLSCDNTNPTSNNSTVSVTGVTVKTATTVLLGNTEQLTATVAPNTATNKAVTWASVNNSVATVSSTGLVTGLAAGTSVIMVTTVDGGFTAQCLVTISSTMVSVTGVSISSSASVGIGATEQLTATITPSTATNQGLTWTSANHAVATVSSTGLVTGIAVGTSVVTVTTLDGNHTAQCLVTVTNNVIVNGTVTDRDGNVYTTVKIGTQEWTVENLRTTKYNDGTAIPHIIKDTTWDSCYYTKTPAYCYYKNTTNADSIKKFGALYNWYAVDTKKLAPAGWHVPTDSEWTVMENYLVLHGFNWDGTTDTSDYNKIAKSLAAKTDWYTFTDTSEGQIGNDLTRNNRSGFSALPGGCRGNNGSFGDVGYGGYWWGSTEYSASNAYLRDLSFCYDDLGWDGSHKSDGFSVRLVRD